MNSPRPISKPAQQNSLPADASKTDDADASVAGAGAQGAESEEDPEMQGEGNYTAARKHRESVEGFVKSGRVEPAARDAAPNSPAEAGEMQAAEAEGRSHARK